MSASSAPVLAGRAGGGPTPAAGETERLRYGPIVVDFDGSVLRPRPWTLAQALWAAELCESAPAGPLLELGCGAGHIGLAAAVLSGRALVQVDDDDAACRWSSGNAQRAGVAQRVTQRVGTPEEVLRSVERFPVVLADPPYVPTGRVAAYPEDPNAAIDGGPDGLDVVRAWLPTIARHLAPGGSVVLQLLDAEQCDRLADELDDLAVAECRAVGDHGALTRLRLV